MLKHYMNRRHEEEGFTLIELMVVVLIIGILIAIALPTFLGARGRAQDKAAASDLRNGFAAAKVFYTDGSTYTGVDAGCAAGAACAGAADVIDGVEPNLDWYGVGDPNPNYSRVVLVEASGNNLDIVRESATGTYFCAGDTGASGGGVHKGTTYASVNTAAKCVALPSV